MKTKETSTKLKQFYQRNLVVCNWCNQEKEGVSAGICNHCGKFGRINIYDDDWIKGCNQLFGGKLTKKQFKEFNPELFKAYINKFSNEDKLKAIYSIIEELPVDLQANISRGI